MPRSFRRWSVRALMIVVAALAVVSYGAVLWRRAAEYRRQATFCKESEDVSIKMQYTYQTEVNTHKRAIIHGEQNKDTMKFDLTSVDRHEAELFKELATRYANLQNEHKRHLASSIANAELEAARASYYGMLRAKYDRAARYPWFPVEPDPPEPRWIPPRMPKQ